MSLYSGDEAWCLSQSLLKLMRCHNGEEFSYLLREALLCDLEAPSADLALGGHEVFKETLVHVYGLHL